MKNDIYEFKIDSFTPETLPMARLAAYIAELANLMGNESGVHFRRLKRGSAIVESAVDFPVVPKVRDRLTRIDVAATGPRTLARSPDDVNESFRKLNTLLAADNAVGRLKRGTAVILKFPGRQQVRVKYGPVTQPTQLVGQLVRIGGRDKTAHGQIEDPEGRTWTIVASRDQARQLAAHLYGDQLKFSGTGRWFRTDDARWELADFRLLSWEHLTNESLRESLAALRTLEGLGWRDTDDPVADIAKLRDPESGLH